MKILVTGATGFVGSHLAERLCREGHQVKTLARPTSDTTLLRSLGVEIVSGDLTDARSVTEAVRGCSRVYHIAARGSQARGSRLEYYADNVTGTETVMNAALHAGVEQVVYCSTVGVHGFISRPPVSETTPARPNSVYRETKWLGEKVVSSLVEKHRLPAVIVRIGSVYGPRGVSWAGFLRGLATRRFRMKGPGEAHQHLGYVSDIVEGLRLCGEADGVEGRTYIIAGPEPIKLRDLIDLLAEEISLYAPYTAWPGALFYPLAALTGHWYRWFGRELPMTDELDFFFSDRVFDITKAREELGYSPAVSMRDGIHRSVQWFREHGYLK